MFLSGPIPIKVRVNQIGTEYLFKYFGNLQLSGISKI
jgi:hypothetical protein